MNYLTLAVNLKNLAISQYLNYDFNSFAEINGTAIGFSQDGIFELDNTKTDNDVEIDAFAEFVLSDWGIPNIKRIRQIKAGYEAEGDIKLILTAGEEEEVYTLAPMMHGSVQAGGAIKGRRTQKGRFWKVRIENTSGYDFSLDTLTVAATILYK